MKRFIVFLMLALAAVFLVSVTNTFATTTGTEQQQAITGTTDSAPSTMIAKNETLQKEIMKMAATRVYGLGNDMSLTVETTAQVQAKSDQQANDTMTALTKYDAARQRQIAKAEVMITAIPYITPALYKVRVTHTLSPVVFCSLKTGAVMTHLRI